MDFDTGRSIYEQIREFVVTGILTGRWRDDERLPSVRDLAVELGVNPNTVQRSYSVLQDEEMIQNQRGVGYFVVPGGAQRARRIQKRRFEEQVLPRLFRTMVNLGYSMDDLAAVWHQWEEVQGELRRTPVTRESREGENL